MRAGNPGRNNGVKKSQDVEWEWKSSVGAGGGHGGVAWGTVRTGEACKVRLQTSPSAQY